MARFFRGRASYKGSDVAALFLLGLMLGGFCYLLLTLMNLVYERLFGGV